MELRTNLGMKIVVLLSLVQGILRTYFGMAGMGAFGLAAKDQVMNLIETPVSNEMLIIAAPFLLLGVFGLAATAGLMMRRPWGIYGTVIVSVATIVYDMWAAVAIQSSAVFGLVVPVICIVYLVARKDAFKASRAVRA
jgi:hypothetical protein